MRIFDVSNFLASFSGLNLKTWSLLILIYRTTVQDPTIWTTLRAPFIEKLGEARHALEKMRIADEAAIQAELTALAFEVMANKRRLSSVCVTDDEGEDFGQASGGRPN